MKKLILILMTILFTCCGSKRHYNIQCEYDVCYPDTTIRYDTIFNCSYDPIACQGDSTIKAEVGSYKGSNYIYISPGMNTKANTTAPIRLYKYKRVK